MPTELYDPTDPHYRYRWAATYDDRIAGPRIEQFQEDGTPQSVGILDWSRVVAIDLIPMWVGHPPLRVHVDPQRGEKAIKFWQVDLPTSGNEPPRVSEVLGLQINVAGHAVKVFCVCKQDGQIILTTNQNV